AAAQAQLGAEYRLEKPARDLVVGKSLVLGGAARTDLGVLGAGRHCRRACQQQGAEQQGSPHGALRRSSHHGRAHIVGSCVGRGAGGNATWLSPGRMPARLRSWPPYVAECRRDARLCRARMRSARLLLGSPPASWARAGAPGPLPAPCRRGATASAISASMAEPGPSSAAATRAPPAATSLFRTRRHSFSTRPAAPHR